MRIKTLVILSFLVLFSACKKSQEGSTVDQIEQNKSQEITEQDVAKLKYVEYALDSKTKGIIQDWVEYSQIKEVVGDIKKGDQLIITGQTALAVAPADTDEFLISDAGTPAISDPGFLLTRACVEAQIEVDCLPGATAFVPALVNSGLPNDKFVFEGFLPVKKGRQTRLKLLAEETRAMIFYESPHRLVKTLNMMKEFFGEDREIVVVREISKLFEEFKRGTVAQVMSHFESITVKGEIVVVVRSK